MQGVTAAIVAFIFVGLALPSLIKNKSQFYMSLVAVLAVIFFDGLSHIVPEGADAFKAFCYVMGCLSQIVALIMAVLATGGLSFRELSGDIIEVIRRGDSDKEVIIPLSEEAKATMRANREAAARASAAPGESKTYTIDTPSAPPKPPVGGTGPLPME